LTPIYIPATCSCKIIFYDLKEKKKGRFFTPQKFKSTYYSSRIIFYEFEREKREEFFCSPKNSNPPIIVLELYSMNVKEKKKGRIFYSPRNSNPPRVRESYSMKLKEEKKGKILNYSPRIQIPIHQGSILSS